jgi:hypothetical protein
MKKPSNKAIAVYLTWGLINLSLLLSSPPTPHGNHPDTGEEMIAYYPTMFFYPFTKGECEIKQYSRHWFFDNFDLQFYDLTEFAFYTIAPILIYYIITLLKSHNTTDN